MSSEDLTKMLLNGGSIETIFEKIKTDDAFVKKYRLQAVRETLTLGYPSYILALAMGSGKTVLIGSIIATEFAMALEYPNREFVKNALVFAPGKTILGALKEISDVPFEKILPPRLYKQFMSSVKITYTQNGEKNIPVIQGSSFNIIVTNTEKIRIQKPTSRSIQTILKLKEKEKVEEKTEVANLRLQTIASLPNLAIFSDEAHHTYGQNLEKGLKKVRKTVDYLAENTNVLVVVNTTGTPYYKKQMLRDVVFWYGLAQGIKDGILKDVKGNIVSYGDVSSTNFLRETIKDFFENYRNVKIFGGSPAKIAIYFPQTDDLKKSRKVVEKTLVDIGLDPSIILEVHNKSKEEVRDLFDNRVNDPSLPYRVFLLVNKGTEGWNCPSLFSTALARKLTGSNNFVLQAATRCLRQIPNNTHKAKIYLSRDNVRILDKQLKETYGESLSLLNGTQPELRKSILVLRKTEVPPLIINKKIKRVIPREIKKVKIAFEKPIVKKSTIQKVTYNLSESLESKHILTEKQAEELILEEEPVGVYEVASELASIYRLDPLEVFEALSRVYTNDEIPPSHTPFLKHQIEEKIKQYKIKKGVVEVALALIKPEGFERIEENGSIIYTTEIVYHKDKENLLLKFEALKKSNKQEFGFHYSPYNFDSGPEKDFFVRMIEALNENPDDIKDIYFTGAITDPNKTQFFFEYKDKDGKWRNYTPDFVIHKKDGKTLIVEVKAKPFKDEEKEMAIREIEGLNPKVIKYEILTTSTDEIGFDNILKTKKWVYGK